MSGRMNAGAYGDALADVYDFMYPHDETADTVAFLGGLLPEGGRVVEFGPGTGRVALPLAQEGFSVHGIEASARMIEKLRERDPQSTVKAVQADFSEHLIDGNFDLCYVVCNTLFMILDAEQQIATLRNAAAHLVPGGHVVVEAAEPSYFHQLTKPTLQTRHLAADKLMLDTIMVDSVNQMLYEVHAVIGSGSVSTFTEASRYAWPNELDLMARLAGLTKVDRFADWDRSPLRPGAERYITVYRKAA